tara:strand:+ start:3625 stop:3801 length:177 start_codon:yes stop_codon:yes gene_type:complete
VASENGMPVLVPRWVFGMTTVLFVNEGRLVEWLGVVCAENAVLLVVGLGHAEELTTIP